MCRCALPSRVVLEVMPPMSSEGWGSIGDSRSSGVLAKRPSVCMGVRGTRLSSGTLTPLVLKGPEGDVVLHVAKAGCCSAICRSRDSINVCVVVGSA
jgi:hypothetical protein